MYTYQDIFENKQRILVVTAHPDDSVFVFFGALMHQLCSEGKEVFVLLATNGARGSREMTISEEALSNIRLQEETAALAVLGVPAENVFCLGYADGEIESSMPLIGEIAKYIRQCKADIVCTHEPSLQYAETYSKDGYFVQHRDHRKIGEAVIDAVYPFSRDRSFFTEHYEEGLEPHSVYDILLTDEAGSNFDFIFSDLVETKRQSMLKHQSQFSTETVQEILDTSLFAGEYMEKFKYLKLRW